MRDRKNTEGGFSLLEMTITLTLLGIVIGTSVTLYGQYRQRELMQRNTTAILNMKNAIKLYNIKHGHYPCPAPLNARPGDGNYGESLDCNDSNGDYTLITRDNLDPERYGATSMRIRKGTFPFMTLRDSIDRQKIYGKDRKKIAGKDSPSGSDVMDAYGRQFTYIVTEEQATKRYAENRGAIRIEDEHGREISDDASFLLISHGANGAGARVADGTQRIGCNQTIGRDRENCDDNSTFLHGLQFHAAGPSYNDDQVAYIPWFPFDLWELTENKRDIHNINPGKVGIGVKSPEVQLHIKGGDLVAYRFWDDTTRNPPGNLGLTSTTNICAEDATDCFTPELIAGDIFPECPSDQVMTGIENRRSKCVPAFQNNFDTASTSPCGSNGYIGGIAYNFAARQLVVSCKCPRDRREGPC